MTVSAPQVPRPTSQYTEPEYVHVQGIPLAYRRQGSGEPVVLLHGHWATRRWLPFHEALAAEVDLIAPEHPGFGATPAPPDLADRADVVLFYRDALDALGLDRVHLCGYGLGGWLAADFAVWFPERVKSLAVLAPFGLRVPDAPIVDVFLLDPARYREAYFSATVDEQFADVVPGAGTPDMGGPEEFAFRYGEMGSAARLMWERRYDTKLDRRLPRLEVPAVVVGGDQDRIVPAAHLQRWAELLGCRVATVPGGHAFPLESPQPTARAVADLVAEVAR